MANCCDPKAPRVFQIQVGDGPVGITGLDRAISEVKAMEPLSEEKVKEELFKKIKAHNYIPDSAREKYCVALFREYQKAKKS
ncbi:MAG: hypothetical protein FH756_07810 [Firmicutes bacterium]|nr:hypothetical protein [Bacillota bacterium]